MIGCQVAEYTILRNTEVSTWKRADLYQSFHVETFWTAFLCRLFLRNPVLVG